MVDNDNKNTNDIIDVQERQLSTDEITRDYVDIKQAAQIMNNVSARTAYRYLDKVAETYNLKPKAIDVPVNGGVKKLYLKEDIINIAKALNKDKMVFVYETVSVNDKDVNDKYSKESVSQPLSINDKNVTSSGKELSLNNRDLFNKVLTAIETLNSSQTKIGELCEVLGKFEKKADTIVDKLMQQGMDFQQNFFDSKKEELKIAMDKFALEKNKIETERKSQESLQELTKAMLEKKNPLSPIGLIILCFIIVSTTAIWGAYFYIKNSELKWAQKIQENRVAEEERTEKIVASLTAIQEELKQQKEAQDLAPKNNVASGETINK